MYTQGKLKDFHSKILKNSICKCKKNILKKIFFYKKFAYTFIFWLIIYQTFIFHIKKIYNQKRLKIEKLNKLNKKINICNKTYEIFFINLIFNIKEVKKIFFIFLISFFTDICKIGKNYLDFFRVNFLLQNKNINKYQIKIENKKIVNLNIQNVKSLKVYQGYEFQKKILFNKDLKLINLYLNEKILKSNYLLSCNLIEQKSIIEQIYDNSIEAKSLYSKVKNQIIF